MIGHSLENFVAQELARRPERLSTFARIIMMTLFWRLYLPPLVTCLIAAAVVIVAVWNQPGNVTLGLALTALGSLVALTISALLVSSSLDPLRELHTALQESTERPNMPVRVYRDDEVGRLASEFNLLVTRMGRQRHHAALLALEAQESERRRIARELHDEVGQSLTLALHQVRSASINGSALHAPDPEMSALSSTLRETLDTVRTISTRLRPGSLDDLGLVPALRELCHRINETTDLQLTCSLQRSPSPRRWPPNTELALYRIAQEAVTNVVRHAHATRATMVLCEHADRLLLSIRDDGTGRTGTPGSGQQGMQERAAMIHGELSIVAIPDIGTSVEVRVPLPPSSGSVRTEP